MPIISLVIILLVQFSSLGQSQPDQNKLRRADAFYAQYRPSEDLSVLKEAAVLLDGLEKADPANYDVRWRCARAYQSLGDDTKPNAEKLRLLELAIESGKRAVEIKPDGVEGHYWLGVSYGTA